MGPMTPGLGRASPRGRGVGARKLAPVLVPAMARADPRFRSGTADAVRVGLARREASER